MFRKKLYEVSFVDRIVQKVTTIPFAWVKQDSSSYLNKTHPLTLVKRYIRNYILLRVTSQLELLSSVIPKERKKILFWYYEKNNIGDSLMELAGRTLIKRGNYAIDLYAKPAICSVFEGDPYFNNIYSDIKKITKNKYDHVIFYEINHRTIKAKIRFFRKIPFSTLFGWVEGIARNQTEFSFAAFNQLFRLGLREDFLENCAKPFLSPDQTLPESHLRDSYIVVCVGGIEPYKIYDRWEEVLKKLDETEELTPKTVFLLGSNNGLMLSERLLNLSLKNIQVRSFVGVTSILFAREIIKNARLVVCCDGGLMHLSCTTDTPAIKLLPSLESARFYLTNSTRINFVFGSGSVNQVAPRDLISEIKNFTNRPH